jgi:hypothetical protein
MFFNLMRFLHSNNKTKMIRRLLIELDWWTRDRRFQLGKANIFSVTYDTNKEIHVYMCVCVFASSRMRNDFVRIFFSILIQRKKFVGSLYTTHTHTLSVIICLLITSMSNNSYRARILNHSQWDTRTSKYVNFIQQKKEKQWNEIQTNVFIFVVVFAMERHVYIEENDRRINRQGFDIH